MSDGLDPLLAFVSLILDFNELVNSKIRRWGRVGIDIAVLVDGAVQIVELTAVNGNSGWIDIEDGIQILFVRDKKRRKVIDQAITG